MKRTEYLKFSMSMRSTMGPRLIRPQNMGKNFAQLSGGQLSGPFSIGLVKSCVLENPGLFKRDVQLSRGRIKRVPLFMVIYCQLK